MKGIGKRALALLAVAGVVWGMNALPRYLESVVPETLLDAPIFKLLAGAGAVFLIGTVGFIWGRDHEWLKQFHAWFDKHVSPRR